MKKAVVLLCIAFLVGCNQQNGSQKHGFAATNTRIRVMGRHVDNKNAVKFGASGVTFFTKFKGSYFRVKLEGQFRDSTNYNWFTVVIDSSKTFRFRTHRGQEKYTLADSLGDGMHTLLISKSTEGENGHNELDSVYVKQLLQADPLPDRKIEFIGNSITAGYGLDNRKIPCDEGTWFDPTNAWYAYGPRVARQLHAQWMNSAVSGIGMHRNWNSPAPVMPDVWKGVYMEYTNDITPWNFDSYTPDLVVIALGTNDFSAGDGKQPRSKLNGQAFVKDYNNFIATVKEEYPEARILLSNSPMLAKDQKQLLSQYLQQVIDMQKEEGDSAITKFAYEGQYTSGCDGHPDFAQQKKMADEIESEIKSFMGW